MIRAEPWKHVSFAFYAACRHLGSAVVVSLTGVRHFNVPDLGRLGGVLIAPNHQSYLDPVLVGMAFFERIDYLAREGGKAAYGRGGGRARVGATRSAGSAPGRG